MGPAVVCGCLRDVRWWGAPGLACVVVLHFHLSVPTTCAVLLFLAAYTAAAGGGVGGMLKAVIDTVIGNLQLSISNVHIRWVRLHDCMAAWLRRYPSDCLPFATAATTALPCPLPNLRSCRPPPPLL